jgi:hypothetical protein
MPCKHLGEIHVLLISAVVGREVSSSRPDCFKAGERVQGTHWIEGCVGPRASLVKILDLTGTAVQKVASPYRMSYRGSWLTIRNTVPISVTNRRLCSIFKCLPCPLSSFPSATLSFPVLGLWILFETFVIGVSLRGSG